MQALRRRGSILSRIATITTAVALALALAGVALAQGQGRVRFGAQERTLDYAYAAMAWGEPYGITVDTQHYASGAEPLEALLAGQVDVAITSEPRLASLFERRPDQVVIIGLWQWGGERHSVEVPAGSTANDLSELVGKKVAARVGSGNYENFLAALEDRGLSENDFQIVNMSPPDMPSALASGTVDAFVAWEPTPASCELKGVCRQLMDFAEYNISPSFLVSTNDYIENNRGNVVAFLRSWFDAAVMVENSPADAAQIVAEFAQNKLGTQIPSDITELGFERINVDPRKVAQRATLDRLRADWDRTAWAMYQQETVDSVRDVTSIDAFFAHDVYDEALSGWQPGQN